MKIKAVLFDIDGVLLDSFYAVYVFYRNLLEHYGYRKPTKKEVSKTFHMTMWDMIKILSKEESEEKIGKLWSKGQRFDLYPIELLKMPKDLKKTIKELDKNYKLGLVTGRTKKGVGIFFLVSKLRKYFQVVVCYESYKKPKPHPESLLIALKRLKVKPEEAVYIGDSWADALAAKRAKIKFISYERKVKGADYNINKLVDLIKVIKWIEQKN